MTNNDYEKAKQECWESSPYDMEQEAFNYVFNRAYQLGKEHAQPTNRLVNERLQVAAMAMQGLLANGIIRSIELVAKSAVSYADTLLTELNEGKNDTDSN